MCDRFKEDVTMSDNSTQSKERSSPCELKRTSQLTRVLPTLPIKPSSLADSDVEDEVDLRYPPPLPPLFPPPPLIPLSFAPPVPPVPPHLCPGSECLALFDRFEEDVTTPNNSTQFKESSAPPPPTEPFSSANSNPEDEVDLIIPLILDSPGDLPLIRYD
ncbi:hypothetical protein PM082_024363 [Marasmius tenuissimus]|nr:hypothetical protein PM082_024363 [Marasmius tenuissimus]